MRIAYKIILTEDKDGYIVYVPDFDRGTQGADMGEAIYMARDLIGILGITLENNGKEIPQPNATDYTLKENEILTFVDVDFAEYRRKHDNRKVKKNLTIPSWLNERAEAENINFSRVLEEALLRKLGIKNR